MNRYNNINLNIEVESYKKSLLRSWNIFEKDFCLMKGKASGSINISNYYKFENKFNLLMLYFYHMSTLECELSYELKKRTNIKVDNFFIDLSFKEFIEKRWFLLNDIFLWFKNKNIKRGMIKYGWFL